ncbi:16S rRNA (guanine(966)-N(2))-methyltransferase RsmD [Pseudoxanthomonas sp.]|uniref:16S rRNA (guanine(966)-N(2))-methyltransferase RsmD n=1 Tax=Pseudoxanthomonas sp. TaxID=1871049 RepID=UPI003F7D794C
MKSGRTPLARGPRAAPGPTGSVRIIGGRWRNTRLPVPDLPGLRPSSDRVRETLFNWLMPKLAGARVLDAFAGSGALGLEAVSRGAAHAVLLERDAGLAAALRGAVERLGAATQARVVCVDALAWLADAPAEPFDIVFLDPPFAAGLWDAALRALPGHLAVDAWVYVESPVEHAPAVPPHWLPHREGRTRDVRYALYRVPGGQGAATLRGDSHRPDSA